MKLADILKLAFGEAEQVIPLFIHNPKSQKIEGIVLTTAEAAVSAFTPPVTPPTP